MVKTNSRRDRFLSYRDGLGIGLVQGWRPLSPTGDTLRFPGPPASLASGIGLLHDRHDLLFREEGSLHVSLLASDYARLLYFRPVLVQGKLTGPGDEVVVPGFTWVVVPAAILYTGAKPAFYDINPRQRGGDPQDAIAKITPRTKAEGFDWSFNPTLKRQQILDLATETWITRKEFTLIVGPSGVGKSHLAEALGQEACRRGYDVLFVAVSKLLTHLHGGHADNTFEKRLTSHLRCDLLILDDFGLRRLKPQEAEDLYEVINARYEHGSVMVTSNRDYDERPEAFGDNTLLASATLDRLAHQAHLITITGRSYRAHDRPRPLAKEEEQPA